MTGDNRYEAILSEKKELRTMCDVAQRLENRGIEKGIKQGIEQGIKQGIEQGIEQGIKKNVMNMHKKDYPLEEIAEITEITVEDVKKIIAEIVE